MWIQKERDSELRRFVFLISFGLTILLNLLHANYHRLLLLWHNRHVLHRWLYVQGLTRSCLVCHCKNLEALGTDLSLILIFVELFWAALPTQRVGTIAQAEISSISVFVFLVFSLYLSFFLSLSLPSSIFSSIERRSNYDVTIWDVIRLIIWLNVQFQTALDSFSNPSTLKCWKDELLRCVKTRRGCLEPDASTGPEHPPWYHT